MFEVVEGDEHYSYVIEGSPQQRVLQNVFHSKTTLLVDVLSVTELSIILDAVPHALDGVLVGKLVEDTIARKDNEIVFFLDLE